MRVARARSRLVKLILPMASMIGRASKLLMSMCSTCVESSSALRVSLIGALFIDAVLRSGEGVDTRAGQRRPPKGAPDSGWRADSKYATLRNHGRRNDYARADARGRADRRRKGGRDTAADAAAAVRSRWHNALGEGRVPAADRGVQDSRRLAPADRAQRS